MARGCSPYIHSTVRIDRADFASSMQSSCLPSFFLFSPISSKHSLLHLLHSYSLPSFLAFPTLLLRRFSKDSIELSLLRSISFSTFYPPPAPMYVVRSKEKSNSALLVSCATVFYFFLFLLLLLYRIQYVVHVESRDLFPDVRYTQTCSES